MPADAETVPATLAWPGPVTLIVVSLPPVTLACTGEVVSSNPPLSDPQIVIDAGATALGVLDAGELAALEPWALDADALADDAPEVDALVAEVLLGAAAVVPTEVGEGEFEDPVAE